MHHPLEAPQGSYHPPPMDGGGRCKGEEPMSKKVLGLFFVLLLVLGAAADLAG